MTQHKEKLKHTKELKQMADDVEYEVQKIIARRRLGQTTQYLCKWVKWQQYAWMDANELLFCDTLIAELEKKIVNERETEIAKIENEKLQEEQKRKAIELAKVEKQKSQLEKSQKFVEIKTEASPYQSNNNTTTKKISIPKRKPLPTTKLIDIPKLTVPIKQEPSPVQFPQENKRKRSPSPEHVRPKKAAKITKQTDEKLKRTANYLQTTHPQTQKYSYPTYIRVPNEYIETTFGWKDPVKTKICKFAVGNTCKYQEKCFLIHVKQEFWQIFDHNPSEYMVPTNMVDESRDPRKNISRRESTFSNLPPKPPLYSPHASPVVIPTPSKQPILNNTCAKHIMRQNDQSQQKVSSSSARKGVSFAQSDQTFHYTPTSASNSIAASQFIKNVLENIAEPSKEIKVQQHDTVMDTNLTFHKKEKRPHRPPPDWLNNSIWNGTFLDSKSRFAFQADIRGTDFMRDAYNFREIDSFVFKGFVKPCSKLLPLLRDERNAIGILVEQFNSESQFEIFMKQALEQNCPLYAKTKKFRLYCMNPDSSLVKKDLRIRLPADPNKKTMILVLSPTSHNDEK
jgi:hypothetical protein